MTDYRCSPQRLQWTMQCRLSTCFIDCGRGSIFLALRRSRCTRGCVRGWLTSVALAAETRRTVPLPAAGNLRALAVLLDDAAARVVVLDHGQSAVRKGFLRVATSMEARPVELWPARRSKGASDRLRSAWERLVEGCVEDAVHYWCAVGSREEAWVARALAASAEERREARGRSGSGRVRGRAISAEVCCDWTRTPCAASGAGVVSTRVIHS